MMLLLHVSGYRREVIVVLDPRGRLDKYSASQG